MNTRALSCLLLAPLEAIKLKRVRREIDTRRRLGCCGGVRRRGRGRSGCEMGCSAGFCGRSEDDWGAVSLAVVVVLVVVVVGSLGGSEWGVLRSKDDERGVKG